MKRIILHLDMDAFFPAVEERENPQFKGMPIVVGADPRGGRGRGVVSSASYSARKFGIKSGMPISKAFKLCPQAIFLPVNMLLYQKVSEKIMKIIKKSSELWEIVSLDEAYLDISFIRSYKKAEGLARKLKKEILKKEKLASTVGIGPNKLIAKLASQAAKPNGLLVIKRAQVAKFLEPLDIQDLPGIGPKTAARFNNIGTYKVKELKKLSKAELKKILGKVGETIYERARGIDKEPVNPEQVVKSIGKEHTFEKDTGDADVLFGTFDEIIEDIYEQLLEDKYFFRTITVICRFTGFETHTKAKTLQKKSNDFGVLKKEAKMLLLKLLVKSSKKVRLIGLRLKID